MRFGYSVRFSAFAILQLRIATLCVAQTTNAHVVSSTVDPDRYGNTEYLRSEILTAIHAYNPKIAPTSKTPNELVPIYSAAYLRRLNNVDDRLQQVSIQATFIVAWKDHRIKWNATEYGLDSLLVQNGEVWTPNILQVESVTGARLQYEYVKVLPNGWVEAHSTLTDNIYCQLELYKFPFDAQHCRLSLEMRGQWAEMRKVPTDPANKRNMSTAAAETPLLLSRSGEFRMLDETELELSVEKEQNSVILHTAAVTFRLALRRSGKQHILTTILPPVLLSLCGTINLYYNSERGERQGYGASVVIALSVMFGDLSRSLPESAAYEPPLMAQLYFGLTVLFLFGTVLHGLPDGFERIAAGRRRIRQVGPIVNIDGYVPQITTRSGSAQLRERKNQHKIVRNCSFLVVFGGQLTWIAYVAIRYLYQTKNLFSQ